jgi:hypothetical protein
MLDWSPSVIRATVGVGGLGFLIYISTLDGLLHLGMGYGPTFVVSFLPALIFFFAAPDLLPAKIVRGAQWLAVVWYFLLLTVSLTVAIYRGLMAMDALFAGFILIGAWPCLLAARRLRATAQT